MQEDLATYTRMPPQMRGRRVETYGNSLPPLSSASLSGLKRAKFMGFVRDEESIGLLHTVLAGHVSSGDQVRLADFRHALTILAAMPTPETVLVDLSGEERPINALMDLTETVDAGTVVLAVGEVHNMNFYRTVIRNLGVREYLPKPLSVGMIAEHFLPVIDKPARGRRGLRGGRMITLCGARGGVGTSCIAANLGWFIAGELHRHTMLLDGEVNTGTLTLDMDIPGNRGLPTMLEAPGRLDQLLVERCVQHAGDRLHVMAGLEELGWEAPRDPEGLVAFIQAIRTRYNLVVADAGARLSPLARQLLLHAQQRVIVMDPTMIALRNMERLRSLPGDSSQAPRPVLVLNKAGLPGGLTRNFIEDQLGVALDVVIPDLPRLIGRHSGLGTLAVRRRGGFRDGIALLAQVLGIGSQPEIARAGAHPSYAAVP